ncbi:hypothetical protein DYBT9275_04373 [Dyadobacter sp. CECT 9275]|uniref:Cytochrome c domain-containing protein n=1 Tax=Dyadobacter helix TaxID=2822344 RepID=A0A916ND65_9BACT|nr:FN3 associated domain-containing protein [Dyadobacter sp. CECT 9275]CAG5008863.1 hypothetical protein DYBT9275_04373 [Dyadobacter sp. CECT 9275]
MAQTFKNSVSGWSIKGAVYNLAFFLNGLLVFLLLFEDRFQAPAWMQPLGRLHPLVLHFPLVVLLIYSIWVIAVEKKDSLRWHSGLSENLLLIGVFTAVIAAFSGFILSQEQGYEADTLFWHKWLGILISLVSIIWYSMLAYLPPWKPAAKLTALGMVIFLLAGGHLGGNLTHGDDFLTAAFIPVETEESRVSLEDAKVYEDLVKPVLEQKCYACHNEQKSKGGLQMQTRELLVKGGKSGVLWDTTRADLGLLLSRIHLSPDDKKHMPPSGKAQLTDEEIVLLAAWVKSGPDFEQKVSALNPQSPVYAYAQNVLGGKRTEEQYDFGPADAEEIKKLNTNYRLIKPLAVGSPALSVNFYNRANFKSSDIGDLSPLKNQIVSMDLSKMPVKDEDLKAIAQFPELRILIMNFTDITGSTLNELKKLGKIREISLSGTAVKMAQVQVLKEIPSLKKVFVWSTGLSTEELAKLKSEKNIRFETGYRSDTVILALNPPVIENEDAILKTGVPVKMKHQIPGTTIRYTLDESEPDSSTSLVYKKPFLIDKNTTIKARAFKEGWYGSKKTEKFFFKAGYTIDSVRLINQPDQKYRSKLDLTIRDGIKSDETASSGKWLGYREQDFQAYLLFKKAVNASSVTLSMYRNIGGFIFPPVRIEIWGGGDEKNLKLLKVLTPEPPDKTTGNSKNVAFTADFVPQPVACIKVIAKPLGKLPPWHPGKGEKAWVFVDEVLVN